MNKKAEFAKGAILILITIVLTSAIIFILVYSGIVEVETDSNDMLLMNFIPIVINDNLLIQNFRFCTFEESEAGCIKEVTNFKPGDEVHFHFEVLSSVFQGEVNLVENYRLIGSEGDVLLEVNDEYNLYYSVESENEEETIYYEDYLVLGLNNGLGEYVFELIVENVELKKSITYIEKFVVI